MHKSEMPAQSPVPKKFFVLLVVCAVILILIGVVKYLHPDTPAQTPKKEAVVVAGIVERTILAVPNVWVFVHLPHNATFLFSPEKCVKEKAFVNGQWREYLDCPNKPIAFGSGTGSQFYFQSASNEAVRVKITYSPLWR